MSLDIRSAAKKHLIPLAEVEFFVPAEIGDYSDFYASIYHARNVGSMFRPDNPLPANYRYIPIGYHGQYVFVISGTPVRRPCGQTRENPAEPVRFGPSQRLDYEMEVGLFVGPGNTLGEPIPIADAESHIFGLCLVNDWSARDIQVWEYQPLGPFLAKSFATSISPWVVTLEALAPFRAAAFERPDGQPAPLPYLAMKGPRVGGVDLTVEVFLSSQQMRQQARAIRLSGNFQDAAGPLPRC